MDKNENGYPSCNRPGSCNPPSRPGFGEQMPPMNSENGNNPNVNGVCGVNDCLTDRPLAYVYAPDQHFRMLYSAADALRHGTLFEELYKPMEVYGRE